MSLLEKDADFSKTISSLKKALVNVVAIEPVRVLCSPSSCPSTDFCANTLLESGRVIADILTQIDYEHAALADLTCKIEVFLETLGQLYEY